MRLSLPIALFAFFAVFILPVVAAGIAWALRERPADWRSASWASAGILPKAASDKEARFLVYTARTGGLKGIVAVHSWIVVKERGGAPYERYDVVGWGRPLRQDAYPPDGLWFSNPPVELVGLRGGAAEALLPRIKAAIRDYAWQAHGDYRIFPGPNSNTFVAHVLAALPELGVRLPPTAIGRDFPLNGEGFVARTASGGLTATYRGVAGFTVGWVEGFEVNLFGLVAGIDLRRPALLLPGLGRLGFSNAVAG